MHAILKTSFINQFQCLGADCPDTCCTKFTVAVDAPTLKKYQNEAPELLDFITEKQGVGKVLKFDEVTGNCPKMSCGSCSIHADYGTEFLTDTCHLYPRITRAFGEQLTMSGSLSCPEVARLALFENAATVFEPSTTDRVPTSLKNYLPHPMHADEAIGLHQQFISLAEQSHSSELFLDKLMFFATRFGDKPYIEWNAALAASWRVMDVMLPNPASDPRDPFFLVILFSTLLSATKVSPSTRLQEILDIIEHALACEIDASTAAVNTTSESMERAAALQEKWREHYAAPINAVLKKLMIAKLSSNMFPYGGLGGNMQQKIVWLAVQMATIKLAISALCYHNAGVPSESQIVQAVQTITRVLDHLANLDMALPMLQETGWLEPSRLSGLLHG